MKVKLNGNDWFEITSDFGNQNSAHSSNYHTGIDLSMPEGTELFSPTDGIIEKVVDFGDKNIGKGVYIKTEDGETLILGHLSDIKVETGQIIEAGEILALSGNTGNSTAPHLHIGLKDSDGYFISPEKFMISEDVPFLKMNLYELFDLIPDKHKGIIPKLMENQKDFRISPDGERKVTGNDEAVENIKTFMEFIKDVKEDGLFYAIYEKSFFELFKDFIKQFFTELGIFILGNADFFFLMPAVTFMFGTFFIGKNKFTKYIIPLWVAYFASTIFHKVLLNI